MRQDLLSEDDTLTDTKSSTYTTAGLRTAEADAEAEASRYRAPALDKGLDILELLAGRDEGMSQIEIAKALARTPNEIYRMLDRLVRRGYVLRNTADRYSLTLKLFGLAHLHKPIRRLVAQALPPMHQFARTTWQACHVAVHDRGTALVVAQEDAPGLWRLAVQTGTRLDLLASASGAVLLAHATPEERRLMLADAPQAAGAPAQDAAFEAGLAEILANGHASIKSAEIEAVVQLAVPVFGPDQRVMAVLCSPWTQRLDQPGAPGLEETIAMLKDTAAAIASGNSDAA